jgi:Rrf2 family transcriptional regulator, cysteine metabolism repressor
MTLLSRKADYALLILSFLHQKPGGGTARAIAEKFGISRPFVANILKELCQNGFVQSHRGVKGGYALARDAASITLAELLESVEDGLRLTICTPGPHPEHENCSLMGICSLQGPMSEVHHRLLEVLRAVTLADLFNRSSGIPQPATLHALPVLSKADSPPVATTVPV